MHKFVASLLLALATTALLSSAVVFSSPSYAAKLTARVLQDGVVLRQSTVPAKVGGYLDLALDDGTLVSVRLSRLAHGEAWIDAIVVRAGLTLSEPSLQVARETTASVKLSELPLTLQFEVH